MSDGVTIEFPKADVDRLFAAMQRAGQDLNVDSGKAMKQAVGYLIRSLGASTRIAPKYREVKDATWLDPSVKRPLGWKKKQLLAFEVHGYFGKPRTAGTKIVFSRDKQTAKKSHARIGNRGLAKLTWKLAGRDLNQRLEGMSFSDIGSAISAKIAAQNVETKSNFNGADIFAEIHNLLPYIRAAVKENIGSVFDRAASAMEKSIDNQLVRRMGLGSLSR